MIFMVSSAGSARVRKKPEERRAEILAAAAAIAVEDGLERITLRAVAERLGVRPGLITHYFPAAEDLVVAAFVRAASDEREDLLSPGGTPLERLAHFVAHTDGEPGMALGRLWLNARHLSRFHPALADALDEQEALDREHLIAFITEGVAAGDFAAVDPEEACVRIWMAVDGKGAYANSRSLFLNDASEHFVGDAAEWALGLPPGSLRPGR